MKQLLTILICFLSIGLSAKDDNVLSSHINYQMYNDLDDIIKNRYIRFLTPKNAFNYYIYQGKHKGYQYELVKKFMDHLNKKYTKKNEIKIQFEIIPVDNNKLIPMLNEGKGDIIAANLTKTQGRGKLISFSTPYLQADELIVRNKNIKKVETVYVRKSSSYFESLNKSKYITKTVPETLDTVNIIELVSLGKYPATVADTSFARISEKVFKNIVVEAKPLAPRRNISWGVRKGSKQLLAEINLFIPKVKKGSFLGNLLKRKYFNDVSRILKDQKEQRISKYDSLIKKYALKYGWDWRLLVSLCYQESHFNPNINNRWGAIGLFQIKQMTANEPYINIPNIKGLKNIENNIHAGVKYLSWIKNRYFDKNKDIEEKDKFRFTLAAYNTGPARLRRAIKLAKKLKLNHNKWFRNVELAMAKMRKTEPVNYVSEINKRFISYKLLGY